MSGNARSLASIYDGWDGYRQSIIHAAAPLTAGQLSWRPSADMRSVGELLRHIALGSIDWFVRMGAPGSLELAGRIEHWSEDPHENRYIIEDSIQIADQADQLVAWLEATRGMIQGTLQAWTVDDLGVTYRHTWRGETYAISRQWTLWRIMAHDLHHGGEFSAMLGMQGIENFELGDLGGHIVLPPLEVETQDLDNNRE